MSRKLHTRAIAWCLARSGAWTLAELVAAISDGDASDGMRRNAHNWIGELVDAGYVAVERSPFGNTYATRSGAGSNDVRVASLEQIRPIGAPKVPTIEPSERPTTLGNTGLFEPLDARYVRMMRTFRGQVTMRGGVEVFRMPWAPWSPTARPRGIPDGYIESRAFLLASPDEYANALTVSSHNELTIGLDYTDLPRKHIYDVAMCNFVWLTCQACKKLRLRTGFEPLGLRVTYSGAFRNVEPVWHCRECDNSADLSTWERHGALGRRIREALLKDDAVTLGDIKIEIAKVCRKA